VTPEQVEIVQSTADDVAADADRFARSFYDRLFEIAPDTRELFPEDLTSQKTTLVEEVVFLARAASDLSRFTERARQLGVRHHHYGVRPAHYVQFEDALLTAMAEVLGTRWTDEVAGAWTRLHRLVSETMLEGAQGELFTPR
jgi:hemoglobin-like flavoprotein